MKIKKKWVIEFCECPVTTSMRAKATNLVTNEKFCRAWRTGVAEHNFFYNDYWFRSSYMPFEYERSFVVPSEFFT